MMNQIDPNIAQTGTPLARAPEVATLGVVSFGLAAGIVWGAALFTLAIVAAFSGWGVTVGRILQSLYIGYSPTFIGASAGAVWGFVHGFVAGVLLAWIYNRLVSRRRG